MPDHGPQRGIRTRADSGKESTDKERSPLEAQFEEEADQFISVFEMLQEYEPGIGLNDGVPVLLGFEKTGSKVLDLEEHVYSAFPHLQYKYDGTTPILRLRTENPELFYENI